MRLNFGLLFLACSLCIAVAQSAPAQQLSQQDFIVQNYSKTVALIPMRDGKKLHTTIYAPRDASQKYPFMMNRTPYSTQPYDLKRYDQQIGPSKYMESDKYIFVHQDVRGRWMSEGDYDNMRPHVPGNLPIDESSDTYDTIDWLLKNVPNNNGRAGIWGISYPGFYSAAALAEHHPALVAASPQAPISDFFFDDFHHNGAYLESYFVATSTFGYQHKGPTSVQWYESLNPTSQDGWSFYMSLGPLSQAGKLFDEDNFFWKELVEHPNYDEFWQKRNILPHLKNVKTNVMTVGGLFDAEDLYGPLHIYRELEKNNPDIYNTLVMGPWSHGDWSYVGGNYAVVGKVAFGKNVSDFYQREVEAPFFGHFLKDIGERPKFEALMYDTGLQKWSAYSQWPPAESKPVTFYVHGGGKLDCEVPGETAPPSSTFVSNPADPVPYRDRPDIKLQFTPREYMSDDQRFAAERKDVLVFQTEPLTKEVFLAGDILANLKVSTTGTDADWIVKLIDVYPENHPFATGSEPGLNFGGFQQMVRSDVMRGRFRNSFEKPEPFVPNEITEVKIPLQDVCHTFKSGHRIMVQVQSTWFPLIDRNPQKYVDNIFKATAEDFVSATHRVFHEPNAASSIELKVFQKTTGESN